MAKDQVVIDLSNYKDKVGARVPEGRYRVVVSDAEPDISNAGNQMVNLWLDIVEGEEQGATIVDRLVLTEKSLFRVVGFMKALGLPTPKKRLSVNIKLWIGRVLFIDVSDGDPYNGNVKSEVRGYIRIAKEAASATSSAAGDGGSDLDGLEEFAEAAPAAQKPWAPAPGTETPAYPSVPVNVEAVARVEQGSRAAQVALDAEVPETVDLDDLDL